MTIPEVKITVAQLGGLFVGTATDPATSQVLATVTLSDGFGEEFLARQALLARMTDVAPTVAIRHSL